MELQNIKNEHLNNQDLLEAVRVAFSDLDFQIKDQYGGEKIIAKHQRFNLYFSVHQCEDWKDRTKQKKYVSASAETVNRYSGMSSPCDSYQDAIETATAFLKTECGYKPPQRNAKQLSLFDV